MSNTELPECLNTTFVKNLLQKKNIDENISVTSLEVKSAVPAGENFLGILQRLKVTYKCGDNTDIKTFSLVIKSQPSCELTRQFIDEIKAFQTEMHVYKTILPAMYQIGEERMPEDFICLPRLTPEFIDCPQKDIFVLEDLASKGYVMKQRRYLFDLDHTKAVVQALARFHAMSYALYLRNPSVFENVQENQFTDAPDRLKSEKDFSVYRINMLVEEFKKWPGYEHYIEKLSKVTENLINEVAEIVKPIKNSISVLNHGDCWVNNILFRHNSVTGVIEDVRFIDFQMCRFSSPVLDLHYFLYTSVREEVLFENLDEVLSGYHAKFTKTLKLLKCSFKEYTFRQFKKEFDEKEYFGFFNAITKLCAVLGEPSRTYEETKILENEKDISTNQGSNKVQLKDMFRRLFPYFESKGFV